MTSPYLLQAAERAGLGPDQEAIQDLISAYLYGDEDMSVMEFMEAGYDLGMTVEQITGIINQWS